MRYLSTLLLCGLLFGCSDGVFAAQQQRLDAAVKMVTEAKTEEQKFHALDGAAKQSFVAGKVEDARKFAQELMALLPRFRGNWNYGNAVPDANLDDWRRKVKDGKIPDFGANLLY
jgi:hypothetical protein